MVRFLIGAVMAVGVTAIGVPCALNGLWLPAWHLYVTAVIVSASLIASAFEPQLTVLYCGLLGVGATMLGAYLDSPLAITIVSGLMIASTTALVTLMPDKGGSV
jgi:hypothetical protein